MGGLFAAVYIAVSCAFLCFVAAKSGPDKTALILKCYCVCTMPLSVEALVRSVIYVRDVWGYVDYHLVSFLAVSVLVSCFCALTLSDKFLKFVTRRIYFYVSLILAFMVIILPFVSFLFAASLQILSVWGCAAAAMYALSQKKMAVRIRELILAAMILDGMASIFTVWSCIFGIALFVYVGRVLSLKTTSKTQQTFEVVFMLALWVSISPLWSPHGEGPGVSSLSSSQRINIMAMAHTLKYCDSHPEICSGHSREDAIDITDEIPSLRIIFRKYMPTRAISVFAFQERYVFLKYNAEAFIYAERGVLPFFGLIGWKSLESRKMEFASSGQYYSSPNFDSLYDGTGDVFYRKLTDWERIKR